MNLKKAAQRGDTIIEIMITTTVLALVLAVSFVSANRSLSSGTQAANRRQALQYAEQQVELIRVAANNYAAGTDTNNPPLFKQYQSGGAFCIKANGAKDTSAASDPNGLCASGQGIFRYGITYASGSQVFNVYVKWEHNGDNGGFSTPNNDSLDQVTLYYQDPLP